MMSDVGAFLQVGVWGRLWGESRPQLNDGDA
jgi:hypothetical protein